MLTGITISVHWPTPATPHSQISHPGISDSTTVAYSFAPYSQHRAVSEQVQRFAVTLDRFHPSTNLVAGMASEPEVNGNHAKKQILLNAFDMSTIGHLSPGQWKVMLAPERMMNSG